MTMYKTRPGVLLTEICGKYFLVSAKALDGVCPYVSQLNETSAFLWGMLEKGMDQSKIEEAVRKEYEITDPAEMKQEIEQFLTQMMDMNYLIKNTQEKD